ncbi:Pleckstrin homology domain [Rhizoctonia solani]|uniref:Pleckstrin homology domain n=1 Tax=Rhizoctonia solani TaxID=456999 RepID=A0A8H7IB24_9AGAM|nr:Pleckstrin homology domain [Rhizoctonia solani]
MPFSAFSGGWNSKFRMQLNSNYSKSSLNVSAAPDSVSSSVYHDGLSRAQGTASELNIDQPPRMRRSRSKTSRAFSFNEFAQLSHDSHYLAEPGTGRANMKSPSNGSAESFHTASAGSTVSRGSHIEDTTQAIAVPGSEDTAKAFAERAWQEDPSFVEREKLVEWLGSPSEIRHQALAYYIAHFEFGGSDIDDAIRQLCNKLYIKGETQQIDRVLEAFSEHYVTQNGASIWRIADIVHVVSFAIILLNTDLQAAELNSHITSSRFVENTIEAVRAQLQQDGTLNSPLSNDSLAPDPLPDIDEGGQIHSPTSPSGKSASPAVNIDRRPSNRAIGCREPQFSERWFIDVSRELSAIYNRIRAKPILQISRHDDVTTSPQSKSNTGLLKRGSAKLYHSLRGESPYGQPSPSTSGASFVSALGHRVSSSMSSLPQFLGITSNQSLQSSASNDPSKSADSRWAKSGPLLWKSMKPTAGRIAKPKRWLSVIATVRNSIFDMSGPAPPGNSGAAGRRLGALSLLHTLAIEVPAPKGVFSKSKSKGGADPDAEVSAWYGWNGVAEVDDDQDSTNGRTRNVLIDDWVAPNLPAMEAQTDVETQLEVWNKQVDMCNLEFAEHGELRGKMMSLYRQGSAQAQKALSNWEKKAQYLLTEIVKYETYAEILRSTELAP